MTPLHIPIGFALAGAVLVVLIVVWFHALPFHIAAARAAGWLMTAWLTLCAPWRTDDDGD